MPLLTSLNLTIGSSNCLETLGKGFQSSRSQLRLDTLSLSCSVSLSAQQLCCFFGQLRQLCLTELTCSIPQDVKITENALLESKLIHDGWLTRVAVECSGQWYESDEFRQHIVPIIAQLGICNVACLTLLAIRKSKRALCQIPFDIVRIVCQYLWVTRNQSCWGIAREFFASRNKYTKLAERNDDWIRLPFWSREYSREFRGSRNGCMNGSAIDYKDIQFLHLAQAVCSQKFTIDVCWILHYAQQLKVLELPRVETVSTICVKLLTRHLPQCQLRQLKFSLIGVSENDFTSLLLAVASLQLKALNVELPEHVSEKQIAETCQMVSILSPSLVSFELSKGSSELVESILRTLGERERPNMRVFGIDFKIAKGDIFLVEILRTTLSKFTQLRELCFWVRNQRSAYALEDLLSTRCPVRNISNLVLHLRNGIELGADLFQSLFQLRVAHIFIGVKYSTDFPVATMKAIENSRLAELGWLRSLAWKSDQGRFRHEIVVSQIPRALLSLVHRNAARFNACKRLCVILLVIQRRKHKRFLSRIAQHLLDTRNDSAWDGEATGDTTVKRLKK
jgi:hypothetical protein